MTKKHKIAILGASGYTGAELVRLISGHPSMEIAALTADRKAGLTMGSVFPQLVHLELPTLSTIDAVDFSKIDLAFCALPHGVAHSFVSGLDPRVKVVDLSADFRLERAEDYKIWYGLDHTAMDIQADAAFGIPEFNRSKIAAARVTANSGCYVASSLLPLVPLLRAGVVGADGIIIDAKSGATGAGRAPNESTLFCEVSDGFHAYGLAGHRHLGELDQELSRAAGVAVRVSFSPHLLPINRGILATIYANGDAAAAHKTLTDVYAKEPFVHVLELGQTPATRHVRGSNMCHIGVVQDRIEGRLIIVSVLDNLMKGASGQAVQNANLMLGEPETAGLTQAPLFP